MTTTRDNKSLYREPAPGYGQDVNSKNENDHKFNII